MKYCNFLMCIVALVCLAFQAFAQSDPLGESARGTDQTRDEMVGWLNQPDPLPADVTKSTTIATTNTTPGSDATKSTTTTTPGFEATFAIAGLMVVVFIALRRRR